MKEIKKLSELKKGDIIDVYYKFKKKKWVSPTLKIIKIENENTTDIIMELREMKPLYYGHWLEYFLGKIWYKTSKGVLEVYKIEIYEETDIQVGILAGFEKDERELR